MASKNGRWSLEYDVVPDEMGLEHIAELIKQGFTEGEIAQDDQEEDEQATA